MTRAQLRARLRLLLRELRDTQMHNRNDIRILHKGIAKAKRLGAEMRKAQMEMKNQ